VSTACRSLVALVIAASAVAAVAAHGTIDIIADYLVEHASYDDVSSHASRGLVVVIATIIAGAVALRGLRMCCDVAANRTVASPAPPAWRVAPLFVGATMLLAAVAVPLMELFDALLAGTALGNLDDAFGGSALLGLGTTFLCAAAIGAGVFALARWILSHRDRVIAAIVGIMRSRVQACAFGPLRSRDFGDAPIHKHRLLALRRGTRAPPADTLLQFSTTHSPLRGYQCYLFSLRRAAS
jgi:hypothetical protein